MPGTFVSWTYLQFDTTSPIYASVSVSVMSRHNKVLVAGAPGAGDEQRHEAAAERADYYCCKG